MLKGLNLIQFEGCKNNRLTNKSGFNYDLKERLLCPFKTLERDTVSFSGNLKTSETISYPLTSVQKKSFLKDIDKLERKAIRYFIDHRLPDGLILDRAPNSNKPPEGLSAKMASVAATGYSLTAMIMAVEKGIVSKEKAAGMVLQSLETVDSCTPEEHKGWLAHFIDADTGKIFKDTEISSVDTALFFFNAFAAAEYFGGAVKSKVESMYKKIDFNMMLTEENSKPDQKAFSLGFHIKDGKRNFIHYKWDEYSEGILVSLLALGSDKVSDKVWNKGWDRSKQWEYGGKRSFVHLPLFTYYYPHGFIDFKNNKDKQGEDFWKTSQDAVQMQIQFCKDQGYPAGTFGITACDGPNGYQPYQPAGTKEYPAHDGTVAPPAILACAPFAEREVYENLQNLKKLNLVNDKYGICNAYNVKTGWKSDDALGIDLGSMLLMTESYHTGLIHKLIEKNSITQKILKRSGLNK